MASRPRPETVAHVSQISAGYVGAEAIAPTLELLATELDPPAVSFFTVGSDGEPGQCVVQGSLLPPAELMLAAARWREELRGIDPLAPDRIADLTAPVATQAAVASGSGALDGARLRRAYRRIGVINDVRIPIRRRGRLVAGLTVWRTIGSRPWSAEQLRLLGHLQPLLELAYLAALSAEGMAARLPGSLTPRQREVALLLAGGAGDAELSAALRISANTAKSHVRAVLRKLGARSRRDVARQLRGSLDNPSSPGPGGGVTPQHLLTPLLNVGAARLGVRCGGCAFLSPRRDPLGQAWGRAPGAEGPGNGSVRRVHAAVLRALRAAERGGQPLGDAPLSRLDPGRPELAASGLGDVLAARGLAAPTVVPLRPRGRLEGVVWLCNRALDHRACEARPTLRRLQPLLELCRMGAGAGRAAAPGAVALEGRGLTSRELEVARLALAADRNAEVAARLGISESTLKKHLSRVFAKCRVRSRAQLIALYGVDHDEGGRETRM